VSSIQPRPARAFHPPFTDFPVAAYVFAAAFDLISAIAGPRRPWALQLWHAGTFVLIGGLCLCLPAMLTGFADLLRFAGTRAGTTRTIVTHVVVMAGVFMIGSGDIAWRLSEYHSQASTPAGILIVSLAAATGVCIGAAHGGTLVFRHAVGVQAASPAPAGALAGAAARAPAPAAATTDAAPAPGPTSRPAPGPAPGPASGPPARHRSRHGR
jgi:uncharacterized membrane protein